MQHQIFSDIPDNAKLVGHISNRFNTQLQTLRQGVLEMGGLVEEQLSHVLQALLNNDLGLAQQIIRRDHDVNAYETRLDEECVNILARQHPTAGDLRFVKSVIKTITDLERIGDETKGIAEQVVELNRFSADYTQYLMELEHLGYRVQEMLHQSLDAFARLDVEAADEIIRLCNFANDEHYQNLSRHLITFMMQDAHTIPHVLEVMWAARALERMGHRGRNICHYVRYCVNGEIANTDPVSA